MIALLRGQIALRHPDGVVIDVGGVGYRVQVALPTLYALPETGEVRLHVYTCVREDAINLYGFLSEIEKNFFGLLISVSGVGPRLAINMLSHIEVNELAAALNQGDITRLISIPGIGKKSAERLVLELQDKAAHFRAETGPGSTTHPTSNNAGMHEDTVSALMNLGYKENLARRALKSLDLPADAALEVVLKNALRVLRK